MKIPLPLTFAFFLSATLASGAGNPTRVFQAGAAISNITPPLGTPTRSDPAARQVFEHVMDDLYVRCLALDDGVTRLAFAVVDSVGVPRRVLDAAKRLVQEETGLAPKHMMMSATHTHSVPSTRGHGTVFSPVFEDPFDDYQNFVVRRIADGVRRAMNNLEPARIGWATGRVPQHVFNRRSLLKEGRTEVNPFGGRDRVVTNRGNHPDRLGPAGPTNPEVYFVSVQSANGRPIALLANYWLHYVGGVPPLTVSADYFPMFAERIRQLLGADVQRPPFVGILANGPCGDVNHIGGGTPGVRYATGERMRLVADDVAQEVARVHRHLQFHEWIELKSAQAELELKLRRPTPELVTRARAVLARPDNVSPIHAREVSYARRTLAAQHWPESLGIPLQVFRLGHLAIAAIPFETFTETGLELKAKSPFPDTFTIAIANGSYGYLPTPAQHELGGYETWLGTSCFETEASDRIVSTITELFDRLKP